MKCGVLRIVMLVALVITVALTSKVNAQVFYSYPGAPVVEKDSAALGITTGFADHLFRIVGYGRFNASPVSDIGVEIILDNGRSTWRAGAAVDFRYEIIPTNTTLPFDLTVDGGLGLVSGDDITTIRLPVGGMISRPLSLENGRILIPYGGIYIIYHHISVGDFDDSDLDIELRMGTSYDVSASTSLQTTLHFGGDFTILYVGLTTEL